MSDDTRRASHDVDGATIAASPPFVDALERLRPGDGFEVRDMLGNPVARGFATKEDALDYLHRRRTIGPPLPHYETDDYHRDRR